MIRKHWITISVCTVALGALLVLAYILGWRVVPELAGSTGERNSALYVWQRAWNPEVAASLAAAREHAQHLMVLAAEDGDVVGPPDWPAVAATGLPATLVFRYSPTLSDSIEDYPDAAAYRVASAIYPVLGAAQEAGVSVRGIQIDYDAPTSTLPDYKKFLQSINDRFRPNIEISITALPDWLASDDFERLVSNLDYFVLRVHALERPDSIATPLSLCDTGRIDGYVTRAKRVGVPYYIALPTCGYQVAYDVSGAFLGLSAESPDPTWPPGSQTREVRADPQEIAACIARLNAAPPDHYVGAAWFRMPVAGDTRTWSWTTLVAVMDGRMPAVDD